MPKAILPFDAGAMVKGLAFRIADHGYAIVGMRADGRGDYKKITDTRGIRHSDIKAAEPGDLASALQMVPGGIAPLPIKGAAALFDKQVLDLDIILCGTGRTDATLGIAVRDLVRIAGGRVPDLSKS